MIQERSYSAHYIAVPDGAIAKFPNEQGISYRYDAKNDIWIGENKVICNRSNRQNAGTSKYYILTVKWLGRNQS